MTIVPNSTDSINSSSMPIRPTATRGLFSFQWRREWKSPGSGRTLLGATIVIALILFSILGERLTSYTSQEMDYEHTLVPPSWSWLRKLLVTQKGLGNLGIHPEVSSGPGDAYSFLEDDNSEDKGPSAAEKKAFSHKHIFGTDRDGRDMLALIVAGSRNCLIPGILACLVALGLGFPLGLLGGYYGGVWEQLIRGFNGVMLSFPRLVLILVLICALEPNIYYTMLVLGLTIAPKVADLVLTRVKILSNMGFILAARESGLADAKIILRHLFWYQNRAVLAIQFSLIMAESIMVETTLSYLKFGTKAPAVSWGNIIEGSQMTFFSELYWITFFPAIAIIVSILGFFYLGDGLNARLAYREGR